MTRLPLNAPQHIEHDPFSGPKDILLCRQLGPNPLDPRVELNEWLPLNLVTLKTPHRPSSGRRFYVWAVAMKSEISCVLFACLLLGCGKVNINDQGYTGTWSDMGSGTIDPTNGSSSPAKPDGGAATDFGRSSDSSVEHDGTVGGCTDGSDCMIPDIPGCRVTCIEGTCIDTCVTSVPDQPPACGPQNVCDDLCVYLARCAGSFCITEDAREYRTAFSVCRETLCDSSPILCEQATCELFVSFARDLSQPFRQLCTGR